MTTVFEKLPEEKRQNVLSAALDEFAAHNYDTVSTNRIVERAEISKGLLFHYFKNKRGLYFYLLRYFIERQSQVYEAFLPTTDRDIFTRIAQLSVHKIQQMKANPKEYAFLVRASQEQAPELRDEYLQLIADLTAKFMGKVFGDIDRSLFRPGVDVQKAIEVILWTTENYGTKYVAEHTDADGNLTIDEAKLRGELDAYLQLLKHGMYLNP